jgi:nicotinamide-nucleotide amidase
MNEVGGNRVTVDSDRAGFFDEADARKFPCAHSPSVVRFAGSEQGSSELTDDQVVQRCDVLASRLLNECRTRGWKIAAAESLTGGLLADAFVRVPGASTVFLGSAVTYDIKAKASVLGVDGQLLEQEGAVHPEVARQMARCVARLYDQPAYGGRVVGLSTTGVAGPGPDGDKPAGLVYAGVSLPGVPGVSDCHTKFGAEASQGFADIKDERFNAAFQYHFSGSREQVRRLTVLHILGSVAHFTLPPEE